MTISTILWLDLKRASLPPSGRMVLLHRPAEDDPVWFGYYDGQHWRDLCGQIILDQAGVTDWAELPDGPTKV